MATDTYRSVADKRQYAGAGVKQRRRFDQVVILAILIALLALTLVPVILMIFMSLKDNGQIFGRYWAMPNPVRWENYTQGVHAMSGYIKNSLIYSVTSVAVVVFLASLSGYVFARHRFPFKEFIYVAILSLLMIPGVLTLIPAFVLVTKELGLNNSPLALILPWSAGGQVFGILLCRTFFATLPEELFDSGRIDGASEFQLYYKIAVPLSWPILVTVAIMHLIGTYNDFIWPLLTISSPEMQVVSVGLTTFTSQYGITDWGPRMAAYAVSTVPLILLFAVGMRYYVRGITSGAIKA
ncbi:MAG: carbohydrate ABC transporter permease [Anaerolineae bacterium]|nr:carbohydrate ABC transporter permease [Anaerolineae bacterium]